MACGGSVGEAPATAHTGSTTQPTAPNEARPADDSEPVEATTETEEVDEDLAAFAALVGDVAHELVERARRVDPTWSSYDAREADGHLIVSFSDWGNGADGGWGREAFVYRGGARVARIGAGANDGQYVWAAHVEPPMATGGVRAAVEAWAEGPVVDEAVLLIAGDAPPRWVLETRQAVLGTRVHWLPPTRGWLVGRYQSRHPGYLYAQTGGLIAIRVADGAAFRLDLTGAYERGRIAGDEQPYEPGEAGMDACLEDRLMRRDSPVTEDATPTPEEWARCEALLSPGIEVAGARLRVRRPDGEWVALPFARLTRLARRLRPAP